MTFSNIPATDELVCEPGLPGLYQEPMQTNASAVSWGAIVAGAAGAAALSFILFML